MIRILLLALLVLAPIAQAGINKCVDKNGKYYFTDKPCPAKHELKESVQTEEEKRDARWEKHQQEQAKRTAEAANRRQQEINAALAAGEITSAEKQHIDNEEIAIGMSEAAVILSWGKPTKINRTGIGSDQWIYERGSLRRQYVYINKGKVTNWQSDG